MLSSLSTAKKDVLFFCLIWLILLCLYIPAAKAGFVGDFISWLTELKTLSFWQYLNCGVSQIRSFYQFTQFITYILYKLIGINSVCWLLLHITLQAINSYLLFKIFRNLFRDAAIANAEMIAATGVVLFCVSPHLSEVLVWKPSFHYLVGFMFILLILSWVQKFHYRQDKKYIWWSGGVFVVSLFSIELFYLTPWLVLAFALYYRLVLKYDPSILKKVLVTFFLPMITLFVVHLLMFRLVYGEWIAHSTATDDRNKDYSFFFSKPAKYIFHVIFLGRYFPEQIKSKVYEFCESLKGIIVSFSFLGIICVWILASFKKMAVKARTVVFIFIFALIALSILVPIGFPPMMLVYGDRYTYVLSAFTYMLLALLCSNIGRQYLATAMLAVYALTNIYFTYTVNIYWKRSAYLVNKLTSTFPTDKIGDNKIVLLLDIPDNMQGLPMIHAGTDGVFKMHYNATMQKTLTNAIYDIAGFNVLKLDDGAHVQVLNDSAIRVTLNQWGTWWWYNGLGAVSTENVYYRLDMKDAGHYYELTLKQPAGNYVLLYEQGSNWKMVDWSKKNTDQY